MNPASPELERLISRFLDEEATADERRRLRKLERSDPRVAVLIEEYAAIDREVGHALRHALGRSVLFPVRPSVWSRLGQWAALAAAACVAVVVWVNPGVPQNRSTNRANLMSGPSWFTPDRAPAGDEMSPVDRPYDRARVHMRDTDRDWIVIPGQRPGEYMVIEVNRIHTHAVAIQNDF